MTVSLGTPLPTSQMPQDNSQPTINEEQSKAWATFVMDEFKKCQNARQAVEKQWELNLAFYYGNQYLAFVGNKNSSSLITNGQLRVPNAPPWRVRQVINRVRPAVRAELAKLTSQKPSASVVPSTSDDDDLMAAQASEQVWESVYSRQKIDRKLLKALFWTCVTGTGIIKTYWDRNAIDPSGEQGDFCIEHLSPWHLFVPDLREQDIEKQSYVIHAYTRPASQIMLNPAYKAIFDAYGVTPATVKEDQILEDRKLNISQGVGKQELIMCYEMWMKPGAHKDFPNGGMLQVIGDVVVYYAQDGIPYQHGEYPFTVFPHIESGKFYATSIIEDIIPLQREFNRTRSQLVEAKNRMAKPQLLAPKGSVDVAKITTEPGQVIEYRPGLQPPTPMPLVQIPPYVQDTLTMILNDIEDITSQHQVSKGTTPPGVTAATAISYLQERDDSVLSTTTSAIEEGMEKVARQVLSMVVQYWDTPRTIKITGDDNSFSVLVLKGSDISGAQDIRMEGGSALPTSKAARQAFLMDMFKMGAISGTDMLKLLEIGGVQKLYEQIQVDERQAQRENLRMKNLDLNMLLQWEQQQDEAKAFAGTVQQLSAMNPADQGLPADMPPLPPDFPGNSTPPVGGDPNAPTLPGMEMQPAQPETQAPVQNPEGTLQDSSSVNPATGLPLDFPLLVPVNTWDNHAIHIDVHNRYRKSQAFEKLSDAHKRLFEAHVQMHAAALSSSANMAMMGGAPPEAIGGGPMPNGGTMGAPQQNQFPPDMGGQTNG